MNPQPLMISDLKMETDDCLRLKVVRVWKKEDGSVGIIFGDAQCTKIQVHVPTPLVEPVCEKVKEEESYEITRFIVDGVTEEMIVYNRFRMLFTENTVIRPIPNITDRTLLHVMETKDLLAGIRKSKTDYLDFFGLVVQVREIRSTQPPNSPNRWDVNHLTLKFKLRDLVGGDMECIATGEFANVIFEKFHDWRSKDHYCILKLWKVVESYNVGELLLTNAAIGCSDIIVDPKNDDYESWVYMVQYSSDCVRKFVDHDISWRDLERYYVPPSVQHLRYQQAHPIHSDCSTD